MAKPDTGFDHGETEEKCCISPQYNAATPIFDSGYGGVKGYTPRLFTVATQLFFFFFKNLTSNLSSNFFCPCHQQ